MPCPVCGYANPAGTRQCAACGTQLIADPKPVARLGDAVCATHQEQPALAPCHRCGTFYCSACLERSGDGNLYCVQCRQRSGLPWDQRDSLGLVRAWFLTCKDLMIAPGQTLAMAPRDGTLGSSLLFATIASVLGVGTTFIGVFALQGTVAALTKSWSGVDKSAVVGLLGGILGFGIFLFIFVAFQLVMLFVLSGIEHIVLTLTGERDLGPYTVTLRSHALSLAPYVLGVLPICGFWVMLMWALVLRCFALINLQKVSAGRAVVAVIAPVVVLCGCGLAFYFMLFAAIFSAAGLSR